MEKITVKFSPDYQPSGSTSFVQWTNPGTQEALKALFSVKSNERITGVEVDEHGITARFDYC